MNGFENGFETDAALPWGADEQMALLLAREQEWAEAYVAEHPACPLGRFYLEFLQREQVTLLGDL